ncbi:MAG TPA: peptide ABC transporter substrate-binding protein [Bdellovibrionota bacterium]|jgi:ABC-type oligopeptide transport system substrate-binding subunit
MKTILLLAALLVPSLLPAANDIEPIRVQISGEPSSLDPALITDVSGYLIASNVYLGLFYLDAQGKLRNGLAESYEMKNGGKLFRFRLKKNIYWSDGKPVQIADFVFALKRTLDPATAARDVSYLFSIKGARKYYKDKTGELGIREKNGALEIELEQPDAALLQVLSMPLAAPLRPDFWPEGKWKAGAPSTGHYRISSVEKGQKILLVPNEKNPSTGQLPVMFFVIPDETIAANMLETGRMDVTSSLPLLDLPRLKKEGWVKSFSSATTSYLGFQLQREPFRGRDARAAVARAVQKKELVQVLGGVDLPAESYLPPGLAGHGKASAPKESKAASFSGQTLRLGFAGTATNRTIAEKIQDDLAKRAGIRVTLEPMEWKVYLASLRSEQAPELFLLGLSAAFNDPISHLMVFAPGNSDNYSRNQNAKYAELFQTVQGLPAGKKRDRAVAQAEKLLEEETILVPLFYRAQLYGLSPKVKGFAANPFRMIRLNDLRRE